MSKCGSESEDVAFKKLLFESLEREKELKRELDEKKKMNDQLRLQLQVERMKIVVKVDETSSEDSEKNLLENFSRNEDLTETFGTNSTVLMQYKYDEVRQAHSKCLRKLLKRTKQLRKVLQEAEIQRFKNIQLENEIQHLNEKVGEVCFRFLKLIDTRSEEQKILLQEIENLKLQLSNN